MIKRTIIVILAVVFSACSSKIGLKESEVQVYNDSARITATDQGDVVPPDGFVAGQFSNRDCAGIKEDENLVRQYATFATSLFLGDIQSCHKFVMKDAIDFHKKEHPSLSEHEIMERYFQGADQMNNMLAQAGIVVEAAIPRFIVKIKYGDEIYVHFQSTLNFFKNGHCFILAQNEFEECIAYSSSAGKKWEFATINKDTRGILSSRCTEETIDTLLNTH